MESHFYIIIFAIVALKIVFWSIYCFVRAKRTTNAPRVVIIDGGQAPRSRGYNDRSVIVNHEVPPATSPPSYPVAPPAYDSGVPKSQQKPPAYNYAV